MKLRVVIRCVDCGHESEVHVQGPWDIEKVTHACSHDTISHYYRDGRKLKEGEFYVGFNPPRRVF